MTGDSGLFTNGAFRLTLAALRGTIALFLVRIAERLLREDGAVGEEVHEDPTAPIRPPLDRA
jgi:hypothetical protein